MLIDTHAHLYWEDYEKDLDQVVQRAIDAGVTTIINVGVDVNLSKKAAELESSKVKFYSTIGIHPHEATKYPDAVSIHKGMAKLEKIYQSAPTKVVAVGECGLDYSQNNNSSQIKLFQAQIDLAKRLNLPLIVHCRDDRSQNPQNSEAWDKVLEMIGSHPAILHCYSGLIHTTKYILQTLRLRSGQATNLFVSFAATITYPKNEYLREAAKILPLEKIVLETDCPFLPPQSKRGQRNEPANILETAQLIAELKKIPLKTVEEQTTKNAKSIFAF